MARPNQATFAKRQRESDKRARQQAKSQKRADRRTERRQERPPDAEVVEAAPDGSSLA